MRDYLHIHPKIVNWPPLTSGSRGLGKDFARPHEGTLIAVHLEPASDGRPARLRIFKIARGELSSGVVLAADPDDQQVLVTLCAELHKLEGSSIADISMLEFDL